MSGAGEMIRSVNESLEAMNAGFKVGAEVDVPVELTYGPITLDTHIRVEITEDGHSLVDPSGQIDRIKEEMKASLRGGGETHG